MSVARKNGTECEEPRTGHTRDDGGYYYLKTTGLVHLGCFRVLYSFINMHSRAFLPVLSTLLCQLIPLERLDIRTHESRSAMMMAAETSVVEPRLQPA